MVIYFCLSVYILSLLVSLVLVITGKKRKAAWFTAALLLHGLFLLLFVVQLALKNRIAPGSLLHYSFLAFLCSGLITGGLILRSGIGRPAKLYFSLFFFSLLFFLYSPSRFALFLARGDLAGHSPKKFVLYKNFFLEEQKTLRPDSGARYSYKLVQQFGLFHKTIRRNIDFRKNPDSIKMLTPGAKEMISLRVYHRSVSSLANPDDSTDLTLSLTPEITDPILKNP